MASSVQIASDGSGGDRRQCQRMPVPNIKARPPGARLQILNMSRRGMAIETRNPFTVGGNYLFELQDDDRSLVIEGHVRWSHRADLAAVPLDVRPPVYHAGVAFVRILPRQPRDTVPAPVEEAGEVRPEALPAAELAEDAVARLQAAPSLDDAAEVLLELLSSSFERLILFRIRRDEVRVWLARGPGLVPERLRKLRLNLDQPSIFLHLREGGRFFFGTLPPMFSHRQIVRCWQGSLDQECTLFPIKIRGRLVCVLYADAGGEVLGARHLGQLRQATEQFTDATVEMILRKKAELGGPQPLH